MVERAKIKVDHTLFQAWDLVPAALWFGSSDGDRVWFNKAWMELVGATEKNAVLDWRSLVHPDDMDTIDIDLSKRVLGKKPSTVNYRIRKTDGSYCQITETVVSCKDLKGDHTNGFLGFCQTEGHVAELPAEETGEGLLKVPEFISNAGLDGNAHVGGVLELLMEGISGHAIILLDPVGHIIGWNNGARKIKGYEAHEIVGQSYGVLFDESDRAAGIPEKILEDVSVKGRLEEEGWRLRKGGERFRAVSIIDAIRDTSGQLVGFAKVTQDITEQVEAKKLLDDARERFAQSQKMESIGQLTGGIAHDFNNLLTVILGNAELLEEGLLTQPRLRHLAELTRVAAVRGAELTNQLLSFARRQPLAPEPIDVNRRVAAMEPMLRRTLGEDVEIELVRGGGAWPAMADAVQFESALLNLCINARDAMPDGGRLTIEIANVHLDNAYASQHADVYVGQYVMVAVSDTGTGMTRDVIARAFEPFFTTKASSNGSGLGLSMVHGFVKQSAGHVKIYSEIDHGTTIKIYLPRAVGDVVDIIEPEMVSMTLGALRILLVEDDDLVREHVANQIESLGFAVETARNGHDALALIRHSDDFDLLFTDVVMPGGMNGRQLADEAKKVRPNLPVLFTSGYTENAIIHHGRLDKGVHLLSKPYCRDELAAKLKLVLDEAASDTEN